MTSHTAHRLVNRIHPLGSINVIQPVAVCSIYVLESRKLHKTDFCIIDLQSGTFTLTPVAIVK